MGIFGEQLMACAALVQIGPARQSFWALQLPGEPRLRERTRLVPRRAEVQLDHGRLGDQGRAAMAGALRIADHDVLLEVVLEEEAGIEALCPHGQYEVWTRKQAGIRAHGTIAVDGRAAQAVQALAVIDDSAGHHARETEWFWTAGVGTSPDGTALAWNLVSGVNDPAKGSERAVWVAGQPAEVAPVSFAPDLSSISCEDGSELHFNAEAERSRHDNLLLLRSDYRAPFGSFSGTLPGGVAVAHGRGVVEYHRARW